MADFFPDPELSDPDADFGDVFFLFSIFLWFFGF